MEGKYGRLFTERDVAAIFLQAEDFAGRRDAVDLDDPEAVSAAVESWIEHAKAPMTFPADEPLFLLRGQDVAAPKAIASTNPETTGIDYAQASLNAGASRWHLHAIWVAASEMRRWQEEHPDRVKVPD